MVAAMALPSSGYDAGVTPLTDRLLTTLELTRLSTAFGAVSNIWFVILLTRGTERYAYLPAHSIDAMGALVVGALVAVGLFAYGAALNDVLDVRHDATFSPQRPIPAGRIKLGQAIVVAIGALIVATLAANAFQTWALWITLLTASGILFYNAAGKYIPAVGFVTIGLIAAAQMFIPNHQLTFTLPIWMVMTQAIALNVAIHDLEQKRPRITRRALLGTILGWLFWSAVLLGAGAFGEGDLWPAETSPFGAALPFALAIAFIVVARRKTRGVSGRTAAEKLRRYGALAEALYGTAWLLVLGLMHEGLWLALFALACFVTMTLVKNLTGLAVQPLRYRG